ncbi:MAG: DUF1028 domain-containing protein [Saprospiraceae bacterium]|nr:DUF1028 domain-containing protein [Saprospiraceae bacterium]
MAGASCTADCSGIGSIIPGTGAIIVQAMSNYNAHDMGRKAILAGHPIEGIMEALRESRFDPEHQQYALVTLQQMNPVTYTGDSTMAYNGALTGYGISVQGNLLTNEKELQTIFNAAVKAQKKGRSVAEILMLALEAGSKAGGDKRCGTQRAQSAFVKVAKPEDTIEKLSLHLVVTGQAKGGENAVAMLRKEYEKWKAKK